LLSSPELLVNFSHQFVRAGIFWPQLRSLFQVVKGVVIALRFMTFGRQA
jgi:hypothetical protein